jgi:hypothetical protein
VLGGVLREQCVVYGRRMVCTTGVPQCAVRCWALSFPGVQLPVFSGSRVLCWPGVVRRLVSSVALGYAAPLLCVRRGCCGFAGDCVLGVQS